MNKLESLKLLRDTIANEENAYTIAVVQRASVVDFPPDSFAGKCGTPACIGGWNEHLKRVVAGYADLSLPVEMVIPCIYDLTTSQNSCVVNPEWFTRARTVAMLDHYIATYDDEQDYGQVDWQALEKSEAKRIADEADMALPAEDRGWGHD